MKGAALSTGTTFFATDPDGHTTGDDDGFYHDDMRHLRTYDVTLGTSDLETLSVQAIRPGERRSYLATPIEDAARRVLVTRRQVVTDGLYERVTVENLSGDAVEDTLSVRVGTDFADIFEIRGEADPAFDRTVEATALERGLTFEYDPPDLDRSWATTVAVDRDSVVESSGDALEQSLGVDLPLDAHESVTVHLGVTPTATPPADLAAAFSRAIETTRTREQEWFERVAVPTAGDARSAVLQQGLADLLELTIRTDHGPVPAAGIPWFTTVFGRDSLITAYQALPVTAELARGTLRYLAAHQATTADDFREARPGKIFHEMRQGELAIRGTVPHAPYYGTVDATALWIVLLEATWRRTRDDDLLEDLWSSLDAAVAWLTDAAADGFIEYDPRHAVPSGLYHQAWKDSDDGITWPDGSDPEGRVAPAEVQGYYYDALRRAASLYRQFRDTDRAAQLLDRASDVQRRFDEAFWLPDEEFYAIALEGGDPIPTVASNPGHCLWSGIVPDSRADAVVDRLLAPDMFSGWGIRTVSTDHAAYNPQSYHRGSVWPHDNSLIARGMLAYDRPEAARTVTDALFDAARKRGSDRLPELLAGFERDRTDVPLEYGTACEPQAWAAAAPLACQQWLEEYESDDLPTVAALEHGDPL